MVEQIKEILLDQKIVEAKIAELAAKISTDYYGKEILLVGILKGAVVFLSELMKHLTIPAKIDFIQAKSYGAKKISSWNIEIKKNVDTDIKGKEVLLVEDIVDTGTTISLIIKELLKRKPASLKLCTLLDKPSRRKTEVHIDYKGFEVPNRFIVGYGLDFDENFRSLPYIAAID